MLQLFLLLCVPSELAPNSGADQKMWDDGPEKGLNESHSSLAGAHTCMYVCRAGHVVHS